MREQSIGDNPRRRAQQRQMPGRESGDASDRIPRDIRAKDVGDADGPQRRTLRGMESPVPAPGETAKSESENTRETTIKERHPDWPNINLNFYFSAHETAEDMKKLPELLDEADVYIFECQHVDPDGDNLTDILTKISQGKNLDGSQSTLTTDQYMQSINIAGVPIENTRLGTQTRALYGKNIHIANIDLRPDDPLIQEFHTATNTGFDAVEDIDQTLTNYRDSLHASAQYHEQRQTLMTERFEEAIADFFEQNPERKKEPINVVISMGSYHTALRRKFQEKGIPSEAVYDERGYIMSYDSQVERSLAWGKEPSHEILLRGYFESLIASDMKKLLTEEIKDNNLWLHYERGFVSKLSLVEIEDYHRDYFLRGHHDEERRLEKITRLMNEKGIPVPRTNQEIAHFVDEQRKAEKEEV